MNKPEKDIEHVVIVGGGLAGVSAAEELRRIGYDKSLTIVGGEEHPPYDRTALSKSVMLNEATIESTALRSEDWYAQNDIQLLTGHEVTGLDLAARRIRTAEWTFGYDRLLLTTGSRARRLPLAEESGAGVHYLRTRADAAALKQRLGGSLLIIGGGWIGLEVAAAARAAGGHVVLVEASPLPLGGVLGSEVAAVFLRLHRSHGVDVRTATTVLGLRTQDGGTCVHLSDGSEVKVDTVAVGIGTLPNSHLAQSAGLACSNGIDVDTCLRTDSVYVYAAGDVANHDHPLLGRVRIEHWDNAIAQGRHAAHSILGEDAPYAAQPYFFTDQYDLGMEYIGHVGARGHDAVHIRGDLESRVFTAYWTRDGQVVAGMHCGDWDAINDLRALVGRPASALGH